MLNLKAAGSICSGMQSLIQANSQIPCKSTSTVKKKTNETLGVEWFGSFALSVCFFFFGTILALVLAEGTSKYVATTCKMMKTLFPEKQLSFSNFLLDMLLYVFL